MTHGNARPVPARPYPRSYWVVPHRLLAGGIPSSLDGRERAMKIHGLRSGGITHIVNLMEEDETDHDGGDFVDYREEWLSLAVRTGRQAGWSRRPIQDLQVPSPAGMKETLDLIDRLLQDDETVYVHCWGGRGRTGTVIGCWLARHDHASGIEILELLSRFTEHARDVFGCVPETAQQRAFVSAWRAGA